MGNEQDFSAAQDSAVSDFFADKNGLEEDVGTVDPDKPNAQSDNDEAAPLQKKPVQQQPLQKPGEGQPQTPEQKAEADRIAKDAPDLEGAEAMLFTDDGKGNHVFNVEKALELAKEDGKVFAESKDPKAVAAEAAKTQPKDDGKQEWERRLERRLETEKTMRGNMTLYRDYLAEALNAGYEGHQATQYADAKIDQVIRLQSERQREEEIAKGEVEREKNTKEREEIAQAKPRAETNIAVLNHELNGNFEKLFIGYQKDGKFVPGIASKDVNMLFEFMNPGAFDDPKSLPDKYTQWWVKLMSNERSARWVANVGRMRLLEKSIPRLLEAQRQASAGQKRRLSEGAGKSPSNIQSPEGGAQADSISDWLKAPPGKKVDIIG
jgi:hypothetical protein